MRFKWVSALLIVAGLGVLADQALRAMDRALGLPAPTRSRA